MNFMDKMKKMKDLQSEVKKIHAALAAQTVTATSGKGQVAITLNGAMDVQTVKIDPKLMENPNVAQLEQYLKEAISQAIKQAQKIAATQMNQMGGGAGLSSLFG